MFFVREKERAPTDKEIESLPEGGLPERIYCGLWANVMSLLEFGARSVKLGSFMLHSENPNELGHQDKTLLKKLTLPFHTR